METRTITQIKVYYLIMNPVTDRAESGRIAMMSTDKSKLLLRYTQEVVEGYSDGQYNKVFRQDGPLEWYNPLWSMDGIDSFGHGVSEDWVDEENMLNLQNKFYFIQ